MKKEKFAIYSLRAERSKKVRYIGVTRNPRMRLAMHISEAQRGKPGSKNEWIRSLIGNGKLPVMDILHAVSGRDNASTIERREIHRHKLLGGLVNRHIPRKLPRLNGARTSPPNTISVSRIVSIELSNEDYQIARRAAFDAETSFYLWGGEAVRQRIQRETPKPKRRKKSA